MDRTTTLLLICMMGFMLGVSVITRADTAYPVPPPKPVETSIKVGTYIFPGWYRKAGTNDYPYPTFDEQSEWMSAIAKLPKPRPVLSFYDDSMPEVNDWHIKWALEAGISWFAFDWYYSDGEKRLARSLEKGFLNARYNEQMQFCINWCNHGLDYKRTFVFDPDALEAMIKYCVDNYFVRPNYLKIKGRPVFMILDIKPILAACGGADKFQLKVLPRLNALCRARGLGDLFLVWDNNEPSLVADVPVGDAFTSYSYHWVLTDSYWTFPGSAPYSEIVEGVKPIWQKMLGKKKPFIVGAQAGWDDSPRTLPGGQPNWVRTGWTPALFEQMLRNGKALVKPEFPYFMIEAWNEWGEGSHLEPSKEFGFSHLDAVRRVFGNKGPNKWARPTPEQVRSYSVLDDEQLAAAVKVEAGPPSPVFVANKSVAYVVDPAELPKNAISEWPAGQLRTNLGIANMSGPELIGGKAVMTVTNGDPFMIIPGNWGPISNIEGIAIRVRINNAGESDKGNFFWETDKMKFGGDTCVVKWKTDDSFHTYLFRFTADAKKDEMLKNIRADFPDTPGTKIEIEWIKVFAKAAR